MSEIVLNYFIKPHDIWWEIISTIRDYILDYNLSSLIFREFVEVPFLSVSQDGLFVHLIEKIHAPLRRIFLYGNRELMCDSFFYFYTTLSGESFTKGSSLDFENNLLNYDYTITFNGDEKLWKSLKHSFTMIISYFLDIKETYCIDDGDDSESEIFLCLENLTKSLIYKQNLIENITKGDVIDSETSELVFGVEQENLGDYRKLFFIPYTSLCYLFNNKYLKFTPIVNASRSNKIYNINFEEIKLTTL